MTTNLCLQTLQLRLGSRRARYPSAVTAFVNLNTAALSGCNCVGSTLARHINFVANTAVLREYHVSSDGATQPTLLRAEYAPCWLYKELTKS